MDGNDRSIAAFTMLGHGLVHWFEMSIPIFLVAWGSAFDASLVLRGLVVALGYAPFGLGALPGGMLADRYGPRRVVLACFAGMAGSFLLLATANSMPTIAAALLLWGAAASVYHPAGNSLISTGANNRGTVFAYHGMAGNIGLALGPFTTATLLIFLDWSVVAVLVALPGLVALAYAWRVEFDPTAATDDAEAGAGTPLSVPTMLTNSRQLFASAFVVVFALVAFEGLFYRGVLTYLPEILQDLDAIETVTAGGLAGIEGIEPGDYVFVGLLVVGIVGQYVGGRLTERVAVERGLLVIFGLLAVLVVAFVPVAALGLAPLLVLCGLLGFFLFAIQPFYQVAVALYTPADTRGLSYGYTFLAEFGIGATSVAVGGFVLGGYTLAAFFLVLAGFAVVAGLLALLLLAGGDRFAPENQPEAAD
ncbi:MAG: sugar phosphate permease [halophilic archaeon J07HX64]|jgi:Sugar phosphate permease|nr:MAG: sugar phosphate permease [halophilic archaeon J07HX64]